MAGADLERNGLLLLNAARRIGLTERADPC